VKNVVVIGRVGKQLIIFPIDPLLLSHSSTSVDLSKLTGVGVP